ARATDVWKSRTFERSEASVSTFTRNPPVLPLSGSVGKLGAPTIFTLTSAHSPSARSPTLSAPPSFERENSTRPERVLWPFLDPEMYALRPYLSTAGVPSSTRRRISWAGLYDVGTCVQPVAGA